MFGLVSMESPVFQIGIDKASQLSTKGVIETRQNQLPPIASLHRPPGHRLTYPLAGEQPVIRQLVGGPGICFHDMAVVEVVAVEMDAVVRIDLSRHNLRFLYVTETRPAALAVPMLADGFAVIE